MHFGPTEGRRERELPSGEGAEVLFHAKRLGSALLLIQSEVPVPEERVRRSGGSGLRRLGRLKRRLLRLDAIKGIKSD